MDGPMGPGPASPGSVMGPGPVVAGSIIHGPHWPCPYGPGPKQSGSNPLGPQQPGGSAVHDCAAVAPAPASTDAVTAPTEARAVSRCAARPMTMTTPPFSRAYRSASSTVVLHDPPSLGRRIGPIGPSSRVTSPVPVGHHLTALRSAGRPSTYAKHDGTQSNPRRAGRRSPDPQSAPLKKFRPLTGNRLPVHRRCGKPLISPSQE